MPVLQIAMPRSPRIYVASFGSLLRLPRPFTDSETTAAIFGKGDFGVALLETVLETGTLVQRQLTKGEVKRAKSSWALGTLREL